MVFDFEEIEFKDPEKLRTVYNFFSSHGFSCRAGWDMQCYFENHKIIGYIIRSGNQDTSIIGLFRKNERFEETKNGLLKVI